MNYKDSILKAINIVVSRPLIFSFLLILVFFNLIDTFPSNLFSGSAWRNTQSFAPYMCFDSNNNLFNFIKCFYAPNLGFDEKAYSGLELPLLPMFDYLLNSKIDIYSFESKMQLLAVIIICVSFILLNKFKTATSFVLLIIFISFLDNPTLNFHILSYQPDLFSIALILLGLSLLLKNEENYIPEILVGIGILFKPQHAMIAFLSFIYLRKIYLNHQNYINLDLIKRSSIIIFIVVISLFSAKISQMIGISVKYPSLTVIVGGFGQYSNIAFDYFIQMFQRNGLQFVGTSFFLFLIAVLISVEKRKALLFLFFILLFSYSFTYLFFLTGFIVNIYYGSVLSLVLMIILLVSFHEVSSNVVKVKKIEYYLNIILCSVLFISSIILVRPKDFYTKLLTDRKEICSPNGIRIFIDKNNIKGNFLLNEPALEPTLRVALGSGKNLWFQDLNNSSLDLYKKSEYDTYYFTCAHFTEMLKNDTNKFNIVSTNFTEIFHIDDWIIFKLR